MNTVDIVNQMIAERAISVRKDKDGANFVEVPNFKPGDTINVAVRVVEGEKEIFHCLQSGAQVDSVFICQKIADNETLMGCLGG